MAGRETGVEYEAQLRMSFCC